MASREFYYSWTKLELAEHMVKHIKEYEDREPERLADRWDRCDMQKELAWADIDEEEGENEE